MAFAICLLTSSVNRSRIEVSRNDYEGVLLGVIGQPIEEVNELFSVFVRWRIATEEMDVPQLRSHISTLCAIDCILERQVVTGLNGSFPGGVKYPLWVSRMARISVAGPASLES